MTGFKIFATAAAVESVSLIQSLDLNLISRMGVVGLLIVAVIVLWRDAGKRQERLEKVLAENSAINQRAIDAMDNVTSASREVKEVIIKCKGHV